MIAMKQAYHGMELNVLGTTSRDRQYRKVNYPASPNTGISPNCYCYRCSFGLEYPDCNYRCAYALEDTITYASPYPSAALIIEPIQQANFSFPPSQDYFKILGDICKKYDMYLIVDEAHYGGVGRLGEWFASQMFNIPADIINTGKGIGNGVPLGISLIREEVLQRAGSGIYGNEKESTVSLFTTHMYDPLIAAAGMAVIEYIEKEKLISRARELGKYILDQLREIQKESRIIGRVDGRGLYIGIELVKDKETKEPFLEAASKFYLLGLEKGVFFPPERGTNIIGIRPPLTIERKNVDKIINVTADTIKQIEEQY